jgi:hypothetical protein
MLKSAWMPFCFSSTSFLDRPIALISSRFVTVPTAPHLTTCSHLPPVSSTSRSPSHDAIQIPPTKFPYPAVRPARRGPAHRGARPGVLRASESGSPAHLPHLGPYSPAPWRCGPDRGVVTRARRWPPRHPSPVRW